MGLRVTGDPEFHRRERAAHRVGLVVVVGLVLLLIISEGAQQALLGDDFSLTQAVLVVATLITLERLWDVLIKHVVREVSGSLSVIPKR